MDTSTVLETEAKKLKNYPFHLEAQKDREVIFLGWIRIKSKGEKK